MAKVSVELRLALDGLRQDVDRARSIIQQGMARNFGGGSGSGLATSPAAAVASMMGIPVPGSSTGTSHIMQSNAFLAQGAKQLAGMGQFTQGPNYRQAGLGVAAGIFSPWIGATILNQSGIFGQGGGGSMLGKLLGGAGVSGFATAYVALAVGTRILKTAFDELTKSVKDATKLFFDAARLHVSAGTLKGREVLMQAMGVPNPQELLQQLAYHKGPINDKNVASLVGMQGQGDVARFMNRITKDTDEFWNRFASNARDFHVYTTALSFQFQKLVGIIANEVLPSINALAAIMTKLGEGTFGKILEKTLGQLVNTMMGNGGKLLQLLAGDTKFNVPKGGTDVSTLGWNRLPMSQFERMGFQIGNTANVSDYAKKTADNTGKIAAQMHSFVTSTASLIGGAFMRNPGATLP